MIKASELRIGNLAQNDCDDRLIQLDAVDILTASKDEDWLIPIPLTPEILEKAGFYRDENTFDYNLNFKLHYNPDMGYYAYDRVDGGSTAVTELHQLQNLYFALKGEELKIELNEMAKSSTP